MKRLHLDPMWREHLLWMLENRPEKTLDLFRKGELKDYLDGKTAMALARTVELEQTGLPPDEAEDLVRNNLVSPPVVPSPEAPGIDPEDEKRVMKWADSFLLPGSVE